MLDKFKFHNVFEIILAVLVCSAPAHAQYIENGTPVSTAPSGQWVEDLTTDGAEGAILIWEDWRGSSIDIYAQRLNAVGYSQWLADGITVCGASGQQQYPRVIPDGSGGSVITWSDSRSGSYIIYAQRIDGSGSNLWTLDGVPLSTGDGWQRYPVIVSDGAEGAIIAWQTGIGASADIYAQRVNGNGEVQWSSAGDSVCTASGQQTAIFAAADGTGGAIVTWTDRRSGGDNIFAQRMDASGSMRWTADGAPICDVVNDQAGGGIAPDGSGGAIIAWTDYRNGASWELYAQRVDSIGTVQWTVNGVHVPVKSGGMSDLRIVTDDAGGIFFVCTATAASDSLFAGRVDGSGASLWTAPISPANTGTVSNLISDGAGGAVVSWETNGDVYSQKIDASGSIVWPEGGVSTCIADDSQQYPVITSDGAGGLIAAWWDFRNSGGSAFEGDVYAARVDENGSIVPTQLASHSAFIEATTVVIQWTLIETGENPTFVILRSGPGCAEFTQIPDPVIERSGLSFRFRDADCRPGDIYRYRVDVIDGGDRRVLFETDALMVPAAEPILHQNHPNPFNPSTTISYVIHEDARVTLEIFDVEGRLVTKLVDTYQIRGPYTVRWNGVDHTGVRVESGVYLYRLTAGKYTISRKMVLLR
jgi:hypothetical protein